MYLLSQIKRNPAITTVTKRGIFGGGRGLFSSSLRNIKTLLIYESGSLGHKAETPKFLKRTSAFLSPTKLSEFPYWLLPSDALEYEADQELLGPNLPVRNAPEGPFLKFSLFKSAH